MEQKRIVVLFCFLYFGSLAWSQQNVVSFFENNYYFAEWLTTGPDFTVYPKNSLGKINWNNWFQINVYNLTEIQCPPYWQTPDTCTTVVQSQDLISQTVQSSLQTFDAPGGGQFQRYSLTFSLDNGASMIVAFDSFSQDTWVYATGNLAGLDPLPGWWPNNTLPSDFVYPNLQYAASPNQIKISLNISNWPFQGPYNYLVFLYSVEFSDDLSSFPVDSWVGPFFYSTINTPNLQVNVTFLTFWVADNAYAVPGYFSFTPATYSLFYYANYFNFFNQTLTYDPDISILLTDDPQCPSLSNCNLHGFCSSASPQTCQCDFGWIGSDCSQSSCPCQNGGTCTDIGTCSCTSQWAGIQCSIPQCPGSCSARGNCVVISGTPTCQCEPGWGGVDCSIGLCAGDGEPCSGPLRGVCDLQVNPPRCNCIPGWTGDDCGQLWINCTLVAGNPCNNGVCDPVSGLCICNSEWIGQNCMIEICPGYDVPSQGNCNFRGTCNTTSANHTCTCNQGWSGSNCTIANCPNNCNNQGNCYSQGLTPICDCYVGYEGDSCQTQLAQISSKGSLSNNGVAGITVGLILFAGLVIGILVAVHEVRRRRVRSQINSHLSSVKTSESTGSQANES